MVAPLAHSWFFTYAQISHAARHHRRAPGPAGGAPHERGEVPRGRKALKTVAKAGADELVFQVDEGKRELRVRFDKADEATRWHDTLAGLLGARAAAAPADANGGATVAAPTAAPTAAPAAAPAGEVEVRVERI